MAKYCCVITHYYKKNW